MGWWSNCAAAGILGVHPIARATSLSRYWIGTLLK